jgi:hypothetical protein
MAPRSTFNTKQADEVIARLKRGEPLTHICATKGFPCDDTIRTWAAANEAFARDIAHAREIGFDVIAGNTRLVARGLGDSTGDVQRDKLIVDTDLKLLAKWDPKRYGEKVTNEHTGKDGGPVELSWLPGE